jgi:hypothetical protein
VAGLSTTTARGVSLTSVAAQASTGEVKELNIILKTMSTAASSLCGTRKRLSDDKMQLTSSTRAPELLKVISNW